MVLAMYSLSLSLKIVHIIVKKQSLDFKFVMHKYIKVLLISIVGIIITSLIEIFLSPLIMKFVISIL